MKHLLDCVAVEIQPLHRARHLTDLDWDSSVGFMGGARHAGVRLPMTDELLSTPGNRGISPLLDPTR